MRLSAIDCVHRGIANLRGNWELVLLYFAQMVVTAVLVVGGLVVVVLMLGASVLFQGVDFERLDELAERLGELSWSVASIAIGLSALFIATTLVSLIYSWFQAGIVSTLDRGERQAPPGARTGWQLFRTFSLREFRGWSNQLAWRFFWFLGWMMLVSLGLLLILGLGVGFYVALVGFDGGAGAVAIGCLAMVPLFGLVLLFGVWYNVGQALVARGDFTVLRASGTAIRIVKARLGAAVLIIALFVIASTAVAVVFMPLSQGLIIALGDSAIAGLFVQMLLGAAQSLINGIMTVALLGTVVALTRTELDASAR